MAEKILDSVEKSIEYGINRGQIDENRDAAVISMLKHMAGLLDNDDSEKSSVMRYVSPASFLNYCEKLGIVPDVKIEKEQPKTEGKNSKLHVVGQSKWKRA